MAADRRSRFRELYKKLDPSGSPKLAIDSGYYVPPPDPLADRIATRLELEPSGSHLLVGGIGSGKTTTLLTVKQRLADTGEFSGAVIDVPTFHNLTVAKPGVLLAIAAASARARLLKQQPEDQLAPEVRGAAKRIQEITNGHYAYPDQGDYDDYDHDSHEVWIKGILQTPGYTPVVAELRDLAAVVVGALGLRPVVLLDGLDRLEDTGAFSTLVTEDVPALSAAGFGVVVVGPQHLRFRPQRGVQQLFSAFHLQGAVPASAGDDGDFLKSVLRARVDAEMLPDETCFRLGRSSGGLLRDLISLGRAAGEVAYGAGAQAVLPEHVETAADRFGRGLLTGITEDMAKRLKEFVNVPRFGTKAPEGKELRFTLATELDLTLLLSRLVIEVPGVPLRYIPHPTTVTLIAGLP